MFRRRKPPDPEVQASLELSFRVLGTVALKRNGLRFPPAPSKPGVYRIRVASERGTAVYVGETTNLSQRFGQYASPGPSQATNLRLNELIASHLTKRGRDVFVDIATEAEYRRGGKRIRTSLADKPARRAAEQIALLVVQDDGHYEILNR